MPSKSTKQANFMAAAAHDPALARKHGISMSTAKEFNALDKGRGIIGKKRKKKK